MFNTINPKEIVVVTKKKNPETISSVRKLQSIYNPHSIFILKDMNNVHELNKIAPWSIMHSTIDDKITFYICENFVCNKPTTDIETAIKYLQ
jgi:Highly conserved protein containing a thioredoxin domain